MLFNACTKHPFFIHESELITRVELKFTDTIIHQTSSFLFCVNDAEFLNRKDTIVLNANTTYQMQVFFYNSISLSELDSINVEIEEEADEHQIFVLYNNFKDFQYQDFDADGMPIGLNSKFTTTENTSSSIDYFRIVLLHQPNKFGALVNINNLENANGETDVDVSFPIRLVN